MKEIRLTNSNLVALVDDADYAEVAQYAWRLDGGYAARCGSKPSILMHRLLCPSESPLVTDHINRVKLDNRRGNLRAVEVRENMLNSTRYDSGFSSAHRGVTWNKQTKRWRARIYDGHVSVHIGCFKSEREAAEALAKAQRLL